MDNFSTLDAASATITGAADEIGGVKFPRVKLIQGADGTNDGDVSSAAPLQVTLANTGANTNKLLVTPDLPTGAATAAKQLADGHSVALSATDNAVLDDIAANQTDKSQISQVCDGSGNVIGATSNALDINIKSGNPTTITATQSTASNLKVELGASTAEIGKLGAGTAEIGKLAAGTALIGATKQDVVNWTPVRKYYTNVGAVTDGIVWSPAAGKKFVMTDLIVNVSAAATVTFEEDLAAGDSVILKAELAANGGFCKRFYTPIQSTEDDADLLVTTSAATIYVTAVGYEID